MPTLAELNRQLTEKGDELQALFDKHTVEQDGKKSYAIPPEVAPEIRKRNEELTEIGKERDELKALADIEDANRQRLESLKAPTQRLPHAGRQADAYDRQGRLYEVKSLGEQFVESDAYKNALKSINWSNPNQQVVFDAEDLHPRDAAAAAIQDAVKATFGTSGSTFTQYDRQPGLILLGQQPLTIVQLLAQGETTMNTIRYPQEDTYTNAADTVAEGAAKPEASWDTSEQDAPVRKIAVRSRVTDEMWEDFPIIRDYINERMRFMVGQKLESQVLSGDGNAPNLLGITNVSGVQTQATGTDVNADAIYRAITKVRTVGFFEPDGVVVHPNNWTPIRLMKTTTGEYIWGAPSEMGPERIWGKPVDVTTGITANTGLVGAFKLGAQIFYRTGIRVEATNSNEDDFNKNLISVRVEIRAALAVYRPKAFCKVTTLGT